MSPLGFPAQVGAVVALAVFWALNWPMMKIGLTVVEPWTFRALTSLAGAIGCLALCPLFGQSIFVRRAEWVPLLWLGLFQGVFWNAFSGFGITLVEAGRASVLAFTMPVWATLFSVIFIGEVVTGRRLAGLLLGMGGIALLLVPAMSSLGHALTGTLLMIAAAASWGIATVILKAVHWEAGTLTLAGWQFIIGLVPITLAAVTIGDPASLLQLDGRTGAALLYSALIPMIFCQAVWFAMVRRLPASLASMGTLLIPPMGVFFSFLILGEPIGIYELGAVVLVVCAMVMILPGLKRQL